MKRFCTFLALLCAVAAAVAGQLCTINPARPGASTGFYVVGPKLYDPTGEEFRIRGINRSHYDSYGTAVDAKLMGANTARIGWLAWASDDVNLTACKANDSWFSMTYTCGRYTGLAEELTTFGQQVVPVLQQLAKPANR